MSAIDAPLDFTDLARRSCPVRLGSEDYLLMEAMSDVAVEYRDRSMRAVRMKDNGVSGFDGLAAVEPWLVSRCLYKVLPDGQPAPQPVTEQFVRSLPNRALRTLYDRVRDMSDLVDTPAARDRGDAEAKKSPPTGTTGSA